MDFWFFIEVLIGGLLSGVMYSLVALGFVLIFKASGLQVEGFMLQEFLILHKVQWFYLQL